MTRTQLKYLKRNQSFYNLEVIPTKKYDAIIVIPILSELDFIEKTLNSLALNNVKFLEKTLVILVINNGCDCEVAKFAENQKLLQKLRNSQIEVQKKSNFNISWIDASSKSCELRKKSGVGMARKIGMDIALEYFNWNTNPILLSLDADTIVKSNYLESIFEYYAKNNIVGANINFKHSSTKNIALNNAINDYEKFMTYYTSNLKRIGSPYAYYSLGSIITCKAEAYIKAGGMKTNEAGEDFYFLQALRKVGNIGNITNTTVYPSPRISNRVPFGTGPRMNNIINGNPIKFYNKASFDDLKTLFDIIKNLKVDDFIDIPNIIEKQCSKNIIAYLQTCEFRENWNKIYINTPKKIEKLQFAFHIWFDAFKTLKYIHFCENIEK